jgi:HEAT repeat protein
MHSIQLLRKQMVRRPATAALAMALFCAGLGLADRFPPDPVEELRQALKGPPPHPDLAQRMEALRTLPEMRRALALQEWTSDVPGTEQIYSALADRFKKEARHLLKNGTADVRQAVMDMLAEMGPSLRSTQDPNGIAGALAPELAHLVKNGDTPRIRAQAARALGLVFPDPAVAVPPLLDLVASPDLQERRAAANALVNMLRVTNELSSGTSNVLAERVPRSYIVQLGTAILPLAGKGLGSSDPAVRRLAAEGIEQLAASLDSHVPQPRAGEEAIDLQGERNQLGSAYRELMPLLEALSQQKPVFATALQDTDSQVCLLILRALESLGSARLKLLRIGGPNGAPSRAPAPGSTENPPPAGRASPKTTNQN